MKKLLVVAVAAFAAGAAVPAIAGDCCGSSASKSADGFACSNPCPLAQQANERRSTGRESFASSNALHATFAASVQRNLVRI